MLRPYVLSFVALLLLAAHSPDDDLDALWAEAARTVAEGDYDAYAALYHPDAVYVNALSGESHPIAVALANWKPGFEATKTGQTTASVAFRFTQRLHSETTAHDTGIFRYTAQAEGEETSTVYIHFEALLVRSDGAWKWIMEYQKALATEKEWDAAG